MKPVLKFAWLYFALRWLLFGGMKCGCGDCQQTFETYRYYTTEKQPSRLPGMVYLFELKVGISHA